MSECDRIESGSESNYLQIDSGLDVKVIYSLLYYQLAVSGPHWNLNDKPWFPHNNQ